MQVTALYKIAGGFSSGYLYGFKLSGEAGSYPCQGLKP